MVSIEFEPAGGWESQTVETAVDSDAGRSRGLSAETCSSYTNASASSNSLRLSVATSGISGDVAVPTSDRSEVRTGEVQLEIRPRARPVFKKGEIIEVLDGKPNAACSAACCDHSTRTAIA